MYIYAKSASYSRKSAYQNTSANGVIFSLHIMHCLITRKQRDDILLYCVHTMLVCKFLAICVVTFELNMTFPVNFNLGNCWPKLQ